MKCRPTGQIRGSNLRVKKNGLAGQGDPTHMKPVSLGSIGRWRVGSGRDVFKFRGSGRVRRFSNLTVRVGSGRVNSFSNFAGWVWSGLKAVKISRIQVNTPQHLRGSSDPTRRNPCDPTRPSRFDLTREKSPREINDFVEAHFSKPCTTLGSCVLRILLTRQVIKCTRYQVLD